MDETDNENEMVIDTSPNTKISHKNKCRPRKRKRISSTSSGEFSLAGNTLEVEKNLQASAVKNNLDDASVKKIIKKVVTNDHVLAYVDIRVEEEGSSTDEDVPTLTRSKAKTVKQVPRVTAPWNLQLNPIEHIPVKTRPEVEALIAQELPDDEDDEEYEPTNDDIPSDDDHIMECSDVDSQPRTPATPRSLSGASPKTLKDGPFKVPQEKSACRQLHMEEEATIALRTRSKLSLSSTPIEHIESSFVPPDEPPVPDVDEIWNDFLKDCLDPASNARHEEDDETDPEYNVAADPDANEDEEGLENSLIKISKKELEDILTELCQVIPGQPEAASITAPPNTTQEKTAEVALIWDGKNEVLSDEEQLQTVVAAKVVERLSSTRLSIGKTEPLDDHESELQMVEKQEPHTQINVPSVLTDVTMAVEEEVVQPLPPDNTPPVVQHVINASAPVVRVDIDDSVKFLPEQVLLLQQQLRQHVQLVTTSFLQVCVHPVHWARAAPYREYLESLDSIAAARPQSVARVCNLRPALELINVYENSVREVTPENKQMVQFITAEMEKIQSRSTHKHLYRGNFPEVFKKVVANSSVFLYPYLLPPHPFRPVPSRKRFNYLRSEDELIALGLDQFWWYVDHNPDLFKITPKMRAMGRGRRGLQAATQLVCKYMMPWMSTPTLGSHIAVVRKSGDVNNPIYKFLKDRTVEPVKHKLLPFNPKITLYEQPEHEMPRTWVSYLAKNSKRFRSYLYRRTHLTGAPPAGVDVDMGKHIQEPEKAPLPIEFTQTYTNQRTSNGYRKVDNDQSSTNQTVIIDSHTFNVVTTKGGIVLVPASQTNTVYTNTNPICTPTESKPKNTITIDSGRLIYDRVRTNEVKIMQKPEVEKIVKDVRNNDETHCKCCILLKKICKLRQTAITEYLQNNKLKKKTCACRDIKYPKISNKLMLFLKYYLTISKTLYHEVKSSLEELRATTNAHNKTDSESIDEEKDMAFVLSFIMKLTIRMNMTRTLYSKKRIDELLTRFDASSGNPLYLAADLHKPLAAEDLGLYKEFMSFLTAEQADRLDKFNDYFIGNCMEDLIKKIEDTVPQREVRCLMLEKLQRMFVDAAPPACDTCCELLRCSEHYPQLARYIFHLFPHRRKHLEEENNCTNCDIERETNNANCNIEEEEIITNNMEEEEMITNNMEEEEMITNNMEEVNNRESPVGSVSSPRITDEGEENIDNDDEDDPMSDESSGDDEENEYETYYVVKDEPINTGDLTITRTEVQRLNKEGEPQHTSESPVISFRIEKGNIKIEPSDWKREEDKLILQIIKQSLIEEGMQNKTVNEIIDSKSKMLSECFTGKSLDDIKERVVHLLQFVNGSK